MKDNTTVVDMRQFVQSRNGQAFTTSQRVAEAFSKQHHHVMQKLESLECSEQFLTSNFSRVSFEHRGNTYDACEMTKDGFMFLVMGFTGKKAASIKEGYIAAFNWMAGQMGLNSTDLVETVIGSTGVTVLDRVIDQRLTVVEKGLRRSLKHTMKSRLRTRFNVQRTDLIPAANLADACNFIAAYAIEGEWLGKEEKPQHRLDIHCPASDLTDKRPGMMQARSNVTDTLDVNLQDFMKLSVTPCEQILHTLCKAGYEIEAAWFEIRTYRNKLYDLESCIRGLGYSFGSDQQFVVDANRLSGGVAA